VTIEGARDGHRPRKAAWSIEARRRIHPSCRLGRAYQYRMSLAFSQAGDIEAVVHSVDEEHVGVTRLPEEGACALRQSDASVTRKIALSAISFGFDDACDAQARRKFVDDVAAEKRPCDDECVPRVPRARKALGDVDH
jgi:hypothetical protein